MALSKSNIPKINSSEITPKTLYEQRRQFIKNTAALGLAASYPLSTSLSTKNKPETTYNQIPKSSFSTDEELTEYQKVTGYNNFYEFGLGKTIIAELAENFQTKPWTITVEGECNKPKVWDVDELVKAFPVEERIYRLRCVEAWSMVIPWVGFELNKLIAASEPTSDAKYIAFETLHDKEQMQGQRYKLLGYVLPWPYREGLRMDEALNPLTILSVGLYGEVLPNQNGAPIRLVVPWKYGFKSIKSIVKIKFVKREPYATWHQRAPEEYGFYANVNPEIDHPRWSQAKERRIGDFLKRPTLKFNGYAEQVAHIYRHMDLARRF